MAASTYSPTVVGSSSVTVGLGGAAPLAHSSDDRSGDERDGVERPTFDDLYRSHFSFIWRSVRRLGVRDAALDDVVQEIFVVVHRRLPTFEGRSQLKTWLFGIALRVVRDHRKFVQRRDPGPTVDPDSLGAASTLTFGAPGVLAGPAESAEKKEAVRVLHEILDTLDDERREIFVLSELEQLPMPEIAVALGINLNTAYGRLRVARQEFEQALERHRARDEWRLR